MHSVMQNNRDRFVEWEAWANLPPHHHHYHYHHEFPNKYFVIWLNDDEYNVQWSIFPLPLLLPFFLPLSQGFVVVYLKKLNRKRYTILILYACRHSWSIVRRNRLCLCPTCYSLTNQQEIFFISEFLIWVSVFYTLALGFTRRQNFGFDDFCYILLQHAYSVTMLWLYTCFHHPFSHYYFTIIAIAFLKMDSHDENPISDDDFRVYPALKMAVVSCVKFSGV